VFDNTVEEYFLIENIIKYYFFIFNASILNFLKTPKKSLILIIKLYIKMIFLIFLKVRNILKIELNNVNKQCLKRQEGKAGGIMIIKLCSL